MSGLKASAVGLRWRFSDDLCHLLSYADIEFLTGLRYVGIGSQAADHAKPPKTVLPERLVTWRHLWNHLDGPPQVRLASNLEAEESRRSNPDDCEWKFIERNVFSYHLRIECEPALPKVVAYDRDRLRT